MLAVLDIGTSKVVVLVAEVKDDDTLEIISVGSHPSQGMKKGMVVNIEEMVDSIRHALEQAELMAVDNFKITSVYVGVAGHHIKSLNCDGAAPIRDGEVTNGDIERAIETAQAIQIASDQQVLHILPRDFIIDGERGIKDPVGMSGYRIEAAVHLITGGINPIQNIKKCVNRCGLEVNGVVMESIASSLSVLTNDEKELGICLVDIGGGTTDIAVFANGAIVHSGVIPIAGDHVTNDIAVSLRTPTQNAEDIKLKHGCALSELVPEGEIIDVPRISEEVQPTQLKRKRLAEIVQSRYEELFSFVHGELSKNNLEDVIVSGIVLTGGSSKVEGCSKLAESIFNTPVRVGHPSTAGNFSKVCDDPIYSTAIGLLHYAKYTNEEGPFKQSQGSSTKKFWNNIRSFFKLLKEHL